MNASQQAQEVMSVSCLDSWKLDHGKTLKLLDLLALVRAWRLRETCVLRLSVLALGRQRGQHHQV